MTEWQLWALFTCNFLQKLQAMLFAGQCLHTKGGCSLKSIIFIFLSLIKIENIAQRASKG